MLNRIPKTLSLSVYRLRANAFSAAMGQIVKCRFYYERIYVRYILQFRLLFGKADYKNYTVLQGR